MRLQKGVQEARAEVGGHGLHVELLACLVVAPLGSRLVEPVDSPRAWSLQQHGPR